MSSRWRRFEVLLPLQFNDGRDVPAEWLAEGVLEIPDRFGASGYETQKVEGHWRHVGVLYRCRASLDVFDQEPLPPGHPFLSLDNTILVPHIGYVTKEQYQVRYRDTVDDIAAYLKGAPLRVLNPEVRQTARR